MPDRVRIEADALGEVVLDKNALYGVNTARALTNFSLSGRTLANEPALVRAFAVVKAAAARANGGLGVLDEPKAEAIVAAAAEMERGELDQWLVVDLLEGAGGTSLNMNVNEVLANRALQRLGRPLGDYRALGPNDHVNRSQSTNDVVPTAIRIACWTMMSSLVPAIDGLARAFQRKQVEFAQVLKLGRTCLQDAQPMTLGQSFGAYAAFAARSAKALAGCRSGLLELPLGATAIGAGFGAPPGYRAAVIQNLAERLGAPVVSAPDLFDALANADEYVRLSGELRAYAAGLNKIANDLMLLSSGPSGGFGEIALPALQAGSSIMPGKVNPVMPMAVCQIAFRVAGCDASVAAACAQGQLEINSYEPLIAASLLEQIRLLEKASRLLAARCVDGIEARRDRAEAHLARSSAAATALLPVLGYAETSRLVARAQAEGRSFLDLAAEIGVLSREAAMRAIRTSVGLDD